MINNSIKKKKKKYTYTISNNVKGLPMLFV